MLLAADALRGRQFTLLTPRQKPSLHVLMSDVVARQYLTLCLAKLFDLCVTSGGHVHVSPPIPVGDLLAEGEFLEFADGSAGDGVEENEGVGELPLGEGLGEEAAQLGFLTSARNDALPTHAPGVGRPFRYTELHRTR